MSSTSYLPPHFRPQLQNYSCNTIRIAESIALAININTVPGFHSPILITSLLYQTICTILSHVVRLVVSRAVKFVCKEKKLSAEQLEETWLFVKWTYCKIKTKNTDILVSVHEVFLVHHILLIYTLYTHKL